MIWGSLHERWPVGEILGFAPPLVCCEAEIDEIVDLAHRASRQAIDELVKESAIRLKGDADRTELINKQAQINYLVRCGRLS